MSIHYESIDGAVRTGMVCEFERDLAYDALYISPRLTDAGADEWPQILREAAEQHDDAWIASELRERHLLRVQEQKHTPRGGVTTVPVPRDAPEILAEGEFNRLYARGLCIEVLASGGDEVEVYRGKDVQDPRAESVAIVGCRLPARRLLDDLRFSQGVEPALGLPPGPNSGLTVRRVQVPERAAQ